MSSILDITDSATHEANRRGWDLWKLRATFPGDFRARTIRNDIAASLSRLNWPIPDIADALGFPTDEACRFGIKQGAEA